MFYFKKNILYCRVNLAVADLLYPLTFMTAMKPAAKSLNRCFL